MNSETISVCDSNADPIAETKRIAFVVAPDLSRGATDNRAAVLATGLAFKHPEIIGEALTTSDGTFLEPFTKVPIVVLSARPDTDLRELSQKAIDRDCTVLVFLKRAQGLRSYEAYRESVKCSLANELDIDSVMIFGPKKAVNSLVGSLPALR